MAALTSYFHLLSLDYQNTLPFALPRKSIRSSSFRETNTALSQSGKFLPYRGGKAPGRPQPAGGFRSELNCSRLALGRVKSQLNRILPLGGRIKPEWSTHVLTECTASQEVFDLDLNRSRTAVNQTMVCLRTFGQASLNLAWNPKPETWNSFPGGVELEVELLAPCRNSALFLAERASSDAKRCHHQRQCSSAITVQCTWDFR